MVLLPILLLATALALPPDHHVLAETDDCVLSIGPVPAEGPRTVRAECLWPEADLGKARALLGDFGTWPSIIPNIRSSVVMRTEPTGVLVHQEHDIPLFADREVLLWMTVADHAGGGFTVRWNKADEPFDPKPGNAVVRANSGRWEVFPAPEGGLRVVHEVAYDPGVRVPEWLVRRYRTNGVATVMREVRSRIGGA